MLRRKSCSDRGGVQNSGGGQRLNFAVGYLHVLAACYDSDRRKQFVRISLKKQLLE
jgi:hypothetical protein